MVRRKVMDLVIALVLSEAAPLPLSRTLNHTTIFMHGLFGHASDFDWMQGSMRAKFGNSTRMHSLPLYEGRDSLRTPLLKQRDAIVKYLVANAESLQLAGGFNLVGHSQGALLGRAVVQALPANLQCRVLVSLAGPQLGQWGMCDALTDLYPHLGLNSTIVKAMTSDAAWLAFYNIIAQDELSVANYWNDPGHQDLFLWTSHFLPYVNNLKSHADMERFKANFLRLEKAVFLGSIADDCINPQLSSVFQFVDTHRHPVPTSTVREYDQDTFGLRTMHQRGDLVLESPPGVTHLVAPSIDRAGLGCRLGI